MDRYGVEHASQNENIKNKMKETNLKRHGVEYAAQIPSNNEKRIQTCMEKYGVEHHLQSKEVLQKQKQTNLNLYGVENISQNIEIKEKKKQTCLKNHNVEHPLQSELIYKKLKETNLKRYGVEHAPKNKEIHKRQQEKMIEKYGVVHFHQKDNIESFEIISDYDWLYKQYIKEGKTIEEISKDLNIGKTTVNSYLQTHKIPIRKIQYYSYKAIKWLDNISIKYNIFIQHAKNIGEYLIPNTRFKADGYCKETNTIYEFYGDIYHGNPNFFTPNDLCHPFSKSITAGDLYKKTMDRENVIKELGYNIISIWETDWDNMKI